MSHCRFQQVSSRWIWLSLSGIIGLSLGDAFLFQSLISVGSQLGTLLLSLAPIFGSIIAWIFFGETLTALQITGIVLALAGIAWVVTSHKGPPNTAHGHTRRGVVFGVLAGLGQAIGLVLSKQGMFGEFSVFQANAIRMLAAVVFIWILTAFESKVTATFTALREKPKVLGLLALGGAPWTGTWNFCSPCSRFNMPRSVWQVRLYHRQKAIHFSIDISAQNLAFIKRTEGKLD